MYLFCDTRSAILQHHHFGINTTTSASPPLLPTTSCLLPANTMSLLPPPEAIYPDPATAFAAIQAHARQHGYAFFQRDKKLNKVVYTCDRAGQYDPKGKATHVDRSKKRNNTGSKKCGCLMRVLLRSVSKSITSVITAVF
jgi:hypothetical protein